MNDRQRTDAAANGATRRPSVLLAGDAERGEFRKVAAQLQRDARVMRSDPDADLARSAGALRSDLELCVLLQSTPGEFSPREIAALQRAQPLLRIVTVAGTWCEGELRSAPPWPGQVRLYWHQWPGWWSVQREFLRQCRPAEWALPLTFREEDRAAMQANEPQPHIEGVVGVASNRVRESTQMLLDIIAAAGAGAIWLNPHHSSQVAGLRAILWDDDDPDQEWHREIELLSSRWPGVPIVALLNFPRVHDRAAVLKFGASAIMAKPYDLGQLLVILSEWTCAERTDHAPLMT